MKKINTITEAQAQKQAEYVDTAIELGLSTEKLDVRKAVEVIKTFTGTKALKVSEYPSTIAALKDRPDLTLDSQFDMSYNAGLTVHLRFITEVLGANSVMENAFTKETLDMVQVFFDLQKYTHNFWVSTEEIILVNRPIAIHLKNTSTMIVDEATGRSRPLRVLHNVDGLAVEYGDGTGIYAIDGITLPTQYEYIIKDWKTLTPHDLLKIENVEIRQAAMSAYGPNIYEVLPHDILDTYVSVNSGIYTLYKIKYPEGKTRTYLSGTCPSKKDEFFEPVHPDCKTCKQSLNWRQRNIISDEYKEPLIRT